MYNLLDIIPALVRQTYVQTELRYQYRALVTDASKVKKFSYRKQIARQHSWSTTYRNFSRI